jgi:two-component system chemotaxis response regulator CheY
MGKKILVVDDEADVRMAIKDVLEDEGYGVSIAEAGKEALVILKKEKFDLAILDFFMPEMSGRELAEEIRKDPQIKNTKFAFLTVADFGVQGKQQLKKLDSLDYIRKPFDNEDLVRRIKKMVGE